MIKLSPKPVQSSFLVRTDLRGVSQRAVLFGPSQMGHEGHGHASGLPGEPHVSLARVGDSPSTEKLSSAFSCPKPKTYK